MGTDVIGRHRPSGHRLGSHRVAPARAPLAERLSRSDPGLIRLLFSISGALAVGLAIGAEYLFVRWTGALHIPIPPGTPGSVAANIDQANHSFLVIAEVLGILVAVCCAMSAGEATPGAQLRTMIVIPVPMAIGLSGAVALAPYRIWSLVAVVVTLGVTGYLRGVSTRGIAIGFGLFMGYFIGFTLGDRISVSQLGWPIAEIFVGLVPAIVVKQALFRPNPDAVVNRLAHSLDARAAEILQLSETRLAGEDRRTARRLLKRLVQQNQARLVFDTALAARGGVPAPRGLQEWIFDVEYAVGRVGLGADAVAPLDISPALRGILRSAVRAVGHGDYAGARALASEVEAGSGSHRGRHLAATTPPSEADRPAVRGLAEAIHLCAEVLQSWHARTAASRDRVDVVATPPTPLIMGWLPGTAIVSARASVSTGSGSRYTHLRLGPHVRATIQMVVAGTLAVVVGDRVSGAHFFWAVLTVFLLFLGPTNAAEQISRSLLRVLGTAVGLTAVVALVHLTGDNNTASITIVIASVLVGLYFMRANAVWLVIAFTIMTSQLFVQLHQYSHELLRVRIEEIGVGAAAVIITVLTVVPLHHYRLLATALRTYLAAVSELLDAVGRLLAWGDDSGEATGRAMADEVKPLVRSVDAAYQALLTSVSVATRPLLGFRGRRARAVAVLAHRSHHDARLLATVLRQRDLLDTDSRDAISIATHVTASSAREIMSYLDSGVDDTYRHSSAALDEVADADRGHERTRGLIAVDAFSEINAIDDSLAAFADLVGMTVH